MSDNESPKKRPKIDDEENYEADDNKEEQSNVCDHPTFGRFELVEHDEDDYRWETSLTLPGFWLPDVDTVRVQLHAYEDSTQKRPDPSYLRLLQTIFDSYKELCIMLKKEFFKEVCGERKGFMWWSSTSLDKFKKNFDEEPQLDKPEDLTRYITEPDIEIHRALPKFGVDKICACLTFFAVFEREHGFAIVTDGKEYLASGYSPNAM